MSDKISGKFHQIPSTIANQRWISILNIIIYLETKFRPNRRIFVFGGHFIPWLPWQWLPFWSFSTPPKAATYYGGYSYKVDHNMAPKPWISIPNIKIYLEINFFVFWQPLWIQNGHHSKPTMNINSQHHHHLHGNQISSKSEIFCIWRPICTLVTMATATILNFFQHPKSCHTLRWILRQKRHKISNVLPPLIHFSCCKQTILIGPIGSWSKWNK